MKKLSNTETELKKNVAYKKNVYIKRTLRETELAINKLKVQTTCHLYSIQICLKQMPRPYE